MSSDSSAAIRSPAQFQRFIEFGRHKLPVDTAVEWRIHPCTTGGYSSPKKQVYQVEVRLNTLKGGRPYGWIDYRFQANTIGKASRLIETLRDYNVKWAVWLRGINPDLGRRAIRLTFSDGWCGTLLDSDDGSKSLSMRDIFVMFSQPAGADSDQYQMQPVDKNQLDLVFGADLGDEELQAQMNATLAKMERLIRGNLVAQFVNQNGDANFHTANSPNVEIANTDDSFQVMGIGDSRGRHLHDIAMPTSSSNDRSPYFDITEDTIQGKNRYMGGGDSHWRGVDIPYLVSRHEPAPRTDKLDREEKSEDRAGDDYPPDDVLGIEDGAASASQLHAGDTELDLREALAMEPCQTGKASPEAGTAEFDNDLE